MPNAIKVWEKKQDYAHELELTKLQIEAARANVELSAIASAVKASSEDGQSARDHDDRLDGGPVINAIKASIRPVVTYTLFFAYVAIKVAVLLIMYNQGAEGIKILNAVWNEETSALFSMVLAFWFGQRFFTKGFPITTVTGNRTK